MRHSIHLILAFVLAITCWPTTSFGQAGNWMMRQNMMNQQRMMQQQRMQQQRMQQQRQMQRQQQAQRRQMAEQRRQQQAAMQQRQRQMQVRKQQMVAQRQKMAEQRRIQQQRRQQEMQRKQSQRQQAAQRQTRQTARIAKDRALRLQRERRLVELRKRTRLQQQRQQRQKAAQETNTVALLSRTANRAAIIKSPSFAKSRQQSTERFAKLRAGRPGAPAAGGSGNDGGGKKTAVLANKQFQQRKLQEFRKRQGVRSKPLHGKPRPRSVAQLAGLKGKACSFHGDTLVVTDKGAIPIRDVRPGTHKVWATSDLTGISAWKNVLAQYSNSYELTIELSIGDKTDGRNQRIITNHAHPFFVANQTNEAGVVSVSHFPEEGFFEGTWIAAGELKVGQRVQTRAGTWHSVNRILRIQKPLLAFNLTVDGFHTYYVKAAYSDTGVWVHNTCLQASLDKKLKGLGPRERLAVIIPAQKEYAKARGWKRDKTLERLNPGRMIYRTKKGEIRSADLKHGHWEKLDSRGKHLGATKIGGTPLPGRSGARDPSGGHDIRVK